MNAINKMSNLMYYSRAAVLIIAVVFMACNLPAGKPALAKQQEVPEQATGMISAQLEMPVGVNLCVYPQNPTTASPLKPSKIGEFASPDDDSDDETYPYRLDPNGKYYHFETFVSDGNTQWDAFEVFEETFTATSTLAPAGANRYDAENLRNDKNRAEGGGIRATTWCEGVAGYGIGERVNMSVKTKGNVGSDEKRRFRSLLIVNGYAKDATVLKNNSRVKILRLHVGGKHYIPPNTVTKPFWKNCNGSLSNTRWVKNRSILIYYEERDLNDDIMGNHTITIPYAKILPYLREGTPVWEVARNKSGQQYG